MTHLCLSVVMLAGVANPPELPLPTSYVLDLSISQEDGTLAGSAQITVQNPTSEPLLKIPFLLHRLMTVQQATSESRKALSVKQDVVRIEGLSKLQVNSVEVVLDQPLQPGKSVVVNLDYDGYLTPYQEVFGYVRESVNPTYSLLRNDTYCFPVVAAPVQGRLFGRLDAKFDFKATLHVPKGYTVAAGGKIELLKQTDSESVLLAQSAKKSNRIDIGIAKFLLQEDPESGFRVFYLPEDADGAARVMNGLVQSSKVFSDVLGEPPQKGLTVIEIPDGWGSQAGEKYVLQAAAAFKDESAMVELYHEVAHGWWINPDPVVQRCRFFDEAFAVFFECYALKSLKSDGDFKKEIEPYRQFFLNGAKRIPLGSTTPIAFYGKHEIGGFSYTKGAYALYVLYGLIGEEKFLETVRSLLTESKDRPMNFEAFQEIAERVAGRDLDLFFQDWIFGVESSKLLQEGVAYDKIVGRYKQ